MDNVLGRKQPGLEDRPALIRLEAAIAETQRLRSVTPLGIPHGTIQVSVASERANRANEKIYVRRELGDDNSANAPFREIERICDRATCDRCLYRLIAERSSRSIKPSLNPSLLPCEVNV